MVDGFWAVREGGGGLRLILWVASKGDSEWNKLADYVRISSKFRSDTYLVGTTYLYIGR